MSQDSQKPEKMTHPMKRRAQKYPKVSSTQTKTYQRHYTSQYYFVPTTTWHMAADDGRE